jgi:hypothetical protein
MRKMLSATLLMCIVALLSVLFTPTVLATKPTYVSGSLAYDPTIVGSKLADGNLHLETTEEGVWSGGLVGESWDEPCRVVIHKVVFDAEGNPESWNFRRYTAISTFETATVGSKSGGLVMRLHGKDSGPGTDWLGKWVILSGTGELANLHGQGTWWGPGFPPGIPEETIFYEGRIHFEAG